MASNYTPSARVSRRALMGAGLASAAVVPLTSLHRASAGSVPQAMSVTATTQETSADPATWRTWLLTSADELRPAAPGAPSQAEIDEVVAAQANSSDATAAAIARWGNGPAIIPWASLAGEVSAEFKISGMPQNRFMAIYHTALHDAAIAAWDAQVAHARPSPGATSEKILPVTGVDPAQPSFPSSLTLRPAASTRSPRRRPSRESRPAPPSAVTSRPGSRWGRRSAKRQSPVPKRMASTPSGTRRPCRPAPASGSRRHRGWSRRRLHPWPAPS
jgi:hypothetical protein